MMSNPMLGDKVEIMNHSNKKYVGKLGKVSSIGNGIKPTTETLRGYMPTTETESRYNLELEDGQELFNLRETQIRQL